MASGSRSSDRTMYIPDALGSMWLRRWMMTPLAFLIR